jgi:hypothetical protein
LNGAKKLKKKMNKKEFLKKVKLFGVTASKESIEYVKGLKEDEIVSFKKLSRKTVREFANYFHGELNKDEPNIDVLKACILYEDEKK